MVPFPRYVRLGGHVIQVRRVQGLIKNEDAFGTWDDGTLTISIDAELSQSLAWETLFHELVEACSTSTDLKLEHHIVQTFGLLIHQAFQSLFEKGQKDA